MITLDVIPDGGEPYRLVATTRDIAVWERRNNKNSFARLQSDMHITDVYAVAHIAAVRLGHYDGTAKDFEASCDLDVLDDDEAASDPTRPGA